MGPKKKPNSDTESGEEKEEIYLSEEDRAFLQGLTEVEREKIMDERYHKQLEKKERERLLSEASKSTNITRIDDKPHKRREPKVDSEGIPVKKPKIDYNAKAETGITLENIEKIRITRDQLAKWWNHLHFEKYVIGAFVRINIGSAKNKGQNIYLMCEVVDVITGDQYYEIDGNKTKTNKLLLINFGKTKRKMKFDIVSNARFNEDEFKRYMERLAKDEMKPITQNHVLNKIQDIETLINYKYTREEIEQIVQKELKESLKKGKIEATAALELEKLRVQLEDLKNSAPEDMRQDDRKDKIRNLEQLIKEVENAIQFDDKIVESDIVSRLNEKSRTKQLEIDTKRVANI